MHQFAAGKGGGAKGESPAQQHGAVCADHLAKKMTARASGVFIGAIATDPIKREGPLRQSADRQATAVGLSRPQIIKNRWELPFYLAW
jgi:hypothetical protein